jgi:hypothetical protein
VEDIVSMLQRDIVQLVDLVEVRELDAIVGKTKRLIEYELSKIPWCRSQSV